MGFKLNYKEHDEGLEVYLTGIIQDSEKTEKEMLKEAGEKIMGFVVADLSRHKRVLEKRYRVSLSDDVKMAIRTNKHGERYARVTGGKTTGTLWHIVNDGNLHSAGLHFMDGALARLDGTMESLWNRILR